VGRPRRDVGQGWLVHEGGTEGSVN
jgi:hypothetical protein